MLFSSQSMLGYTEKTKSKYDSLIKLISNEDIKLSECEPYNIASLNWLIEKGSIYIKMMLLIITRKEYLFYMSFTKKKLFHYNI